MKRTAVIIAGFAVSLAAGLAGAQERPVELRFAHWVPATHPLARTFYDPWLASVEKASKGLIKVSKFPAEQLGKAPDHYDMARDGIADVTWVNPGYQAGRFPIFAAGELPFMMTNARGGSGALDAWYRKYAGTEMKDVHFCMAHLHIGALHSKNPITSPDQIKGMKIRPANGTVARFMTSLGATNVQLTAPQARDALEKGIADAITFPWDSIRVFGIDKTVKNHIDFQLYQAAFVWVMNKNWYSKLGPTQKKVIDDHCSNEWATNGGGAWGDDEDSGKAKLAAAGHTIVKLSAGQMAAWRKAAEVVYTGWSDEVKKAGHDGAKILGELREELKKRNVLQN
jgi:TRAP-type C4-dicarboxylate transport system substrate-binding protein